MATMQLDMENNVCVFTSQGVGVGGGLHPTLIAVALLPIRVMQQQTWNL